MYLPVAVALGYIQKTATQEECETAFENLCILQKCQNENEVMV